MFARILSWLSRRTPPAPPIIKPPSIRKGMRRALASMQATATDALVGFPLKVPDLPRGVVPEGKSPALAMDASFLAQINLTAGFPGYPYLSNLATRAEFRAMASAMATEITREWIELTSKSDDGDNGKLKEIEAELIALGVRETVQRAVEHDCYFGRAQIFIDCCPEDNRDKPLILDKRTVALGSLKRVTAVEPVWTTPSTYNTLDPSASDFFKPPLWFMLGKEVHASRLQTVITRPLPDLLKPAFNFGGMSLSQLAEPYVENWLRTRQSVADLINNFSTSVLATDMGQLLGEDPDDPGAGGGLMNRAALFTQMRSNKGLMVVDKDREEFVQVNTPLSGLHELQAQSQEHMCAVSRMPAIVLTGISPSGLNASSDGEIRIFYDWIAAQQEAYWRKPIETIIQVIQLSKYGEIDPDIGFVWKPLYQMTPAELADIRLKNAQASTAHIQNGVIDPSEERERLAADPESGYLGLDTDLVIVQPEPEPTLGGQVAQDKGFEEGKHPRADNGQFGPGGGAKVKAGEVYSHLAKKDDEGGRSAVEKAAHDLIKEQPELENEVRREMSDLGYSMPSKQEAPQKRLHSKEAPESAPTGNVSKDFGEPEYVRAGYIEPPHEVRDREKLADLVDKMKAEGWQGRPILTVDLGRGPEALTGSHRIRAAKQAGIDVPTIQIDPDIGNYEDENGKTIREAMYLDADEAAEYLEKAGEPDAANLMRAEYEAQEKGYGK